MTETEQKARKATSAALIQNTVAALVVVAGAGLVADLVLWPRDQLPAVTSVSQYVYFGAPYIERAASFRGLQGWLGLVAAMMLVLVPWLLALFWPRPRQGARLARFSDRRNGILFGHGGSPTAALVAAGITLLTVTSTLPFTFAAFMRSRDFGLSVESIHGWLWSWVGAVFLTILAIAVLAVLALWLIRLLGRGWWLAFGGCLIVLAIAFQMLSPVLIEPLFADFKPLPAGQLRSDVERLSGRAGVDAGEIYVVDAANRTRGANAYVSGLGATRRVVIYDTLIKDFSPAERRQVIAHELGHARHRDLVAGLVWFGFVAMVSLFAVDMLARTLARRREIDFASPAAIATLAAAVILAIAVSQPAANAWSRAIEARADAFALRITRAPDTAIAMERRLTVNNLARPEPPAVRQLLFGTHPTPMQRIGMAVTVRRELAAGKVEAAP